MVISRPGGAERDNRSEGPWAVRPGAMTPHWPCNRLYLFPPTAETPPRTDYVCFTQLVMGCTNPPFHPTKTKLPNRALFLMPPSPSRWSPKEHCSHSPPPHPTQPFARPTYQQPSTLANVMRLQVPDISATFGYHIADCSCQPL